jgi:serine/threonine protein kinase
MPADTTTFQSEAHAYTVLRELGKGGQGQTLEVEREGEPGSRYVLKLLRIEHVDDWKQVELFEREVTTLAALDHPGIPRLCDRIVEDGRTAGIIQSFVEGHTVAAQIATHGPQSAERFERILRECLEILAYLQGQVPPVVHRDINPRNVMLGPERVYLIDFGAARVGGKTDMTSVGTFGYMPPEQLIGRPEPASDMYGLGMTLVSLAERRDVSDLPQDASTGRVDGSRLLRSVEPRVRDVVLAMIEPGLGERLSDPREALRRLDAPAPTPATKAKTPLWEHLVNYTVGTITTVMILAATVPLLFDFDDDSPPVVVAEAESPRPGAPIVSPPPLVPPLAEREPAPVEHTPVPVEQAPPVAEPVELTDENSAMLHISTTPPGALVFIDYKGTCKTPCSARVSFGRHTVRLERNDRAVDRTVHVLEETALKVSMVE